MPPPREPSAQAARRTPREGELGARREAGPGAGGPGRRRGGDVCAGERGAGFEEGECGLAATAGRGPGRDTLAGDDHR